MPEDTAIASLLTEFRVRASNSAAPFRPAQMAGPTSTAIDQASTRCVWNQATICLIASARSFPVNPCPASGYSTN